MKRQPTSPSVKKANAISPSHSIPSRRSQRTFLEQLESRIAPAALVGIDYKDITIGTPQLLKAGQGIKANGAYIMAVTAGQALVYTTDLNGNNQFDANEITGIAAGNGLKMTSFVDINGDIVTNLKSDGTLSDSSGNGSSHDGLFLLNSKITAITLRSLTAADTPANDSYLNHLIPSTYSIHGNIYAGGGIGDGVVGDGIVIDTAGIPAQVAKFDGSQTYYQVATIEPSLGAIKTGTAAGGNTFSFGNYTGNGANAGQLVLGGTLKPYTPGIGVAGGDIIGLSVGSGASNDKTAIPSSPAAFTIDALVAGDGGIGAKGGSITNITLNGDTGGLRIQAGDGGNGANGGAGGSITNLSDLGSVESLVQINTGKGGEGYTGPGGAAGTLSFGTFDLNGNVHINGGDGGNGLTSASAGSSITKGTLTPTDAGGIPSALSIVSTYRAAGDIGKPSLIDFNGDGFADIVFMTSSPDQVGIRFGSATGINSSSPVLYFASPTFSSLDNNGAGALVVGDFNGATYADGTPVLDIAVASTTANSTNGINVFINPAGFDSNGQVTHNAIGDGSTFGSGGGWSAAATFASVAVGNNYIDTSIHVALPMLNTLFQSNTVMEASGYAVTNLVVGDFGGPNGVPDGYLDLGFTAQTFDHSIHKNALSVITLSGTGDGHFFADFGYNNNTLQDTKNPVNNILTDLVSQPSTTLLATAAVQGISSSDILVYSALNDSVHPDVHLLQNVSGTLTSVASLQPRYDTAKLTANNGVNVISGWSPTSAVPTGIAITDVGGDNKFDVMVVDQGGQAVCLLAGQYSSGTPSFAAYSNSGNSGVPSSGGVILTGAASGQASPNINTLLLSTNSFSYNFTGIMAGAFTGGTSGDAQFALYTNDGNPTKVAQGFYEFDLADYNLHGPTSYKAGSGLTTIQISGNDQIGNVPTVNAGDYDAKIQVFDIYNPDATTHPYTDPVGYVTAIPISKKVGGFDVYDTTGVSPSFFRLNTYALDIRAGSGGNSHLGAGGAGGNIGTGTATITNGVTTAALSIILPATIADQPFVTLDAGVGGSGLTNGGNGGGLQGLNLTYVAAAGTLGGGFNPTAAAGGSGFFGKGGNGGSITGFQIQTGYQFHSGNGGVGYQGGNGGAIDGSAGVNGYSTYNGYIFLFGGNGAPGIVSGGTGGRINGFKAEFPVLTGGVGGSLDYVAGSGGSAIAGTAGAGGSILSSSPISTFNNLAGPILMTAGSGGNGLAGGAGGAITNFSNQSTANTAVTVVSIEAGNGGKGITGAGGAGGGISNIYASGQGVDSSLRYQYNRIIAGDGGASYGAVGGVGGGLNGVTSTAQASAEALVAGSGGDGLTRGGAGGAVVNVTGDSADSTTSKVLVFAGAGGNAYAALALSGTQPNPGVANDGDTSSDILKLRAFGNVNGVGGNGGGISNFTQPKSTQASVDMIAGNGGSVLNYGNPANTSGVGIGGSVNRTSLAGTAGQMDLAVPILTYGGQGTSVQDFVQKTLRHNPPNTQLTDGVGNVGVIVGAAGTVKGGLPSSDAVAKTGSVTTFSANSIMSMVAGSVDRIAAINTVSGVTSTSGVYGAYKTNPVGPQAAAPNQPQHDSTHALYFAADGTQVSTPVAGDKLMDGAIVALNNPGNLVGPRVWKLS